MIEQFNELERFQDYSNQLDLLRLNIQSSILPFDPVLAETFEKRTNELSALHRMPSKQSKTMSKQFPNISNTIAGNECLIREWNVAGFSYEGRSQILPSELLEWEHILPEVEQQYHRHAGSARSVGRDHEIVEHSRFFNQKGLLVKSNTLMHF